MAANCPSSVPALLAGCMDAYRAALAHANPSVANAAKKGALALTQLSATEKSRVSNALMEQGIMVDVQLQLAMTQQHDATAAACLLLLHLAVPDDNDDDSSSSPSDQEAPPVPVIAQEQNEKKKTRQSAGDTSSSDFRSREQRQDSSTTISSGSSSSAAQRKEPTLRQLLLKNPKLMQETLLFLKSQVSKIITHGRQGGPPIVWGRLCLLLKAYNWLLLLQMVPNSDIATSLLANMIPDLEHLAQEIKSKAETLESESVPEKSSLDGAFGLVLVATILTWARILTVPVPDSGAAVESRSASTLISGVMHACNPSISRQSDGLMWRLSCLVKRGDTFGLHTQLLQVLTNTSGNERQAKNSFRSIEAGLELFCEKATPENGCQETVPNSKNGGKEFLQVRLSALLIEIQGEQQRDDVAVTSRIKEMLQIILSDDDSVDLVGIMHSDDVSKFVVDATVFLTEACALVVPMILPVQIETRGLKLDLGRRKEGDDSLIREESRFLLQLLHAFEFLEQQPKSPFVFDPRALPMKEILTMCKTLASGGKALFLNSRLHYLAEKHCPEVLLQMQRKELQKMTPSFVLQRPMSRREAMESLRGAILATCEHSNPDQLGPNLEGIFLFAKLQLPESELCTTVTSALLSTPNKSAPYYTYALLCRDPLVLFQCSMKVWKCRSLRRIALTILCSLLETNGLMITDASQLEDAAVEFLAARNALVVRCLLVAVCGAESGVPSLYCSMTTSILRRLLGQRGLVALLIKQGLPEAALDWMIEYIPETMGDSKDLTHMLSDRSSLTPSERLVAADAVLRIAITHGHCNEVEAEAMAYTALTQLVNSFFLVIGPVGVPVNVLIGDGSGLDVTQISRTAAFRILKSLLKVGGRRARLRNECGMALQKLAGLCKGESAFSGVAGNVAGRRKTLLKEIFEAVTKAANRMGSGIGSQALTA
jgi:hypothetical protein